ncbi:MAG: cytochrome c biogenesis CcdA family protein [Ilumatobacteraceae bacterium]
MTGPYALALAAGMAATVNPCGFALLPAYLSMFVGLDERESKAGAIGRALAVSVVVTAGFVVVFGAFGVIVTPLALRVEEYLPWVTIVLGMGLVGLGTALLLGRQLLLRLPKLHKGGQDGTLPSMFLFGISYAVASLSCTIGPFLAVTTSTFQSESWLNGLGVFVAYGIGMGTIVAIATTAVALAKSTVLSRFRDLAPKMHRVAGGFLVTAGTYVAYYGWYEIRVRGGATRDPIIDRALDLQARLQRTVVPDDPQAFALRAFLALAAVSLASAALHRRRHRRTPPGLPDQRSHGAAAHRDDVAATAVE